MEDLIMHHSVEIMETPYTLTLNCAVNHIPQKEKNIKKLVYICFDFKGNFKKDIMLANKYCKFAASKGVIALSPYMLCAEFTHPKNYTNPPFPPFIPLDIIPKCDELWCFGLNITNSIIDQLEKAHTFSKPIKYFSPTFTQFT